jgi:ATP-binding cassette subfamily B protein
MSVVMATFMVSMIPRAAVSAGRAQEVLDTTTSVTPPASPVLPRTHGQVEFRGAGFHYPGAERAVLTDVSFRVMPGETTAVIGSSGAGKTTLVNLIPRLFDVTSGSVLVGDTDVRDIDPVILSSKLGLVPQKPYLFSGTVRSTLQYGNPDATEDEMWEALRVAQAEDFVRAMPDQLDARIEQGGTNVSGGQRQRLSIARA